MTAPKTLLTAWSIRAQKKLGQNFLIDPSTAGMIVTRARLQPEDVVLEIGAGLGALTIPTARRVKKVYAVEIDHQIIELLKTEILVHKIDNVNLIRQNILAVNLNSLIDTDVRPLIVMGNLPYSISSQIIVWLINNRPGIQRAVLMLQKELTRRLTADPGGRAYSRLSVMLNYCAEVKTIARVRGSLFFPKAMVDSEVIEVSFSKKALLNPDDEDFFFRVVKAAFSQRRKMLKNALTGSELQIDAKTVRRIFEKAAIDPARRAETLTVAEFIRLSKYLAQSTVTE